MGGCMDVSSQHVSSAVLHNVDDGLLAGPRRNSLAHFIKHHARPMVDLAQDWGSGVKLQGKHRA
jgi:hypothetical protein